MDIYNRWGALVYRSESVADGWDGFFLGKPAPAGVYAYVVVIQENGREKTITGEVNLLR